jgi:hypothetical protein
VRFLRRFVTRAAKLLGEDTSAAPIQSSFQQLLADIRAAIQRHPESAREAALKHMLATSKIFGAKIFSCYDHPDLPRTDNGLEGVFRDTRRHERLITGHKSTARRTVRDGPLLLPALQRARRETPTLDQLSRLSSDVWRKNLADLRELRRRFDRPRRLRHDLHELLEQLVKRISARDRARAP